MIDIKGIYTKDIKVSQYNKIFTKYVHGAFNVVTHF